jgi:hypothetical protein
VAPTSCQLPGRELWVESYGSRAMGRGLGGQGGEVAGWTWIFVGWVTKGVVSGQITPFAALRDVPPRTGTKLACSPRVSSLPLNSLAPDLAVYGEFSLFSGFS